MPPSLAEKIFLEVVSRRRNTLVPRGTVKAEDAEIRWRRRHHNSLKWPLWEKIKSETKVASTPEIVVRGIFQDLKENYGVERI